MINIIEWISNWAEGIIVAVIIGTIIEMLLPQGNSKKYIKVVIGIYVLFTIVSPVITKVTGKDIKISDILDLKKYVEETEETVKIQNTIQDQNTNNIKDIYLDKIKGDMKEKISKKGYNVNNIQIELSNDDNYKILCILLEIEKNNEDGSEKNTEQNKIKEVESINKIEISIGEEENSMNIESNDKKRRERFI